MKTHISANMERQIDFPRPYHTQTRALTIRFGLGLFRLLANLRNVSFAMPTHQAAA